MTTTPIAGPKDSLRKSTAKFAIAQDGSLEGDVRIELTGHLAVAERNRYEDDAEAQIAEGVKKDVKEQYGEAEVGDVHVENLTDSEKPFVTAYHIKVAAFAQRTGKRLFFQPAVLEMNKPPRYATSERKYMVEVPYPWSENEQVSIQLPEGFELDHADMPGPITVQKIAYYNAKAAWTGATHTLHYSREFSFGESGVLMIPQKSYPALKALFDSIHEKDGHMITAKLAAATSAKN